MHLVDCVHKYVTRKKKTFLVISGPWTSTAKIQTKSLDWRNSDEKTSKWTFKIMFYSKFYGAQPAGTEEYTDCISAKR